MYGIVKFLEYDRLGAFHFAIGECYDPNMNLLSLSILYLEPKICTKSLAKSPRRQWHVDLISLLPSGLVFLALKECDYDRTSPSRLRGGRQNCVQRWFTGTARLPLNMP